MNCAAFEEQIARYVGGDLSLQEAANLTQHLGVCQECAELARDLEADREWLGQRPREAVEVDYDAMRGRIRAQISQSRSGGRWIPALVAAAAVLLVIALLPHRQVKQSERVAETVAAAAHVAPMPSAGLPAPVPAPRPHRTPKRTVAPKPDGDLEIALRLYQALDVVEPSEPTLPPAIEMQIATRNPDVRILLVPENNGDSR